jgi:hypothetical protein
MENIFVNTVLAGAIAAAGLTTVDTAKSHFEAPPAQGSISRSHFVNSGVEFEITLNIVKSVDCPVDIIWSWTGDGGYKLTERSHPLETEPRGKWGNYSLKKVSPDGYASGIITLGAEVILQCDSGPRYATIRGTDIEVR